MTNFKKSEMLIVELALINRANRIVDLIKTNFDKEDMKNARFNFDDLDNLSKLVEDKNLFRVHNSIVNIVRNNNVDIMREEAFAKESPKVVA